MLAADITIQRLVSELEVHIVRDTDDFSSFRFTIDRKELGSPSFSADQENEACLLSARNI